MSCILVRISRLCSCVGRHQVSVGWVRFWFWVWRFWLVIIFIIGCFRRLYLFLRCPRGRVSCGIGLVSCSSTMRISHTTITMTLIVMDHQLKIVFMSVLILTNAVLLYYYLYCFVSFLSKLICLVLKYYYCDYCYYVYSVMMMLMMIMDGRVIAKIMSHWIGSIFRMIIVGIMLITGTHSFISFKSIQHW